MRQNVTKILNKSQLVSYNQNMDINFLEFEEYIKEEFGIDGIAVGNVLNSLLMFVIEDKVQNEKTHLLYKARAILKSDNNVK